MAHFIYITLVLLFISSFYTSSILLGRLAALSSSHLLQLPLNGNFFIFPELSFYLFIYYKPNMQKINFKTIRGSSPICALVTIPSVGDVWPQPVRWWICPLARRYPAGNFLYLVFLIVQVGGGGVGSDHKKINRFRQCSHLFSLKITRSKQHIL